MSIIQQKRNNATSSFFYQELLVNDDAYKKTLASSARSRYRELLIGLNDIGYVVVDDFFSQLECNKAICEIERLFNGFPEKVVHDSLASDNRLFGVEKVSDLDEIRKINNSELIDEVTSIFYNDMYSGFTMAAKMVFQPNNLGSGGGWHRDSAQKKQIKSILYLCDVEQQGGPFQYLEKSHLPHNVFADTFIFGCLPNQRRFSDDEIEKIKETKKYKLATLTAKAGTLILADTRGLHRGMPIQKGSRYALTNYFWGGSNIPEHIKKLCVKY